MWIKESVATYLDPSEDAIFSQTYFFDEEKYPHIRLPRFGGWFDPQVRIKDPLGVLYFKFEKVDNPNG